MAERYLDPTECSFVAGPLELPERFSSVALHSSIYYTCETIEEAFLVAPGARLIHRATPSWEQWLARWESGRRYVEVAMTLCEVAPEGFEGHSLVWGGSFIKMHCLLQDFLGFWEAVRGPCPGVWLHDTETLMWSPDSFAREVIAFRERTQEQTWRPGWGKL
jgi:hypothetical protein